MMAGHEQAKSGRLMEGKGPVHNWEETGYFRKTWAEFQFPDLPAEDHRFRDRLAPFPLLPPGGSELLQCSLPWLLSIASWVYSIRTCGAVLLPLPGWRPLEGMVPQPTPLFLLLG